MCYGFETYHTKARIAEELRKRAEEQKTRAEAPVAPKPPAEATDPAKTPDTVPA